MVAVGVVKVMHPEQPNVVLYDGPTQLTFYQCVNGDCDRAGIPYQIRESWPTGKPLFDGARKCRCGRLRQAIKNTTERES